jgi:malonyl-CoA O-methyltransferase
VRRGVFVSGTDTGIGKTLTSALLLTALRARGVEAGYFKPVQTGDDADDTRTVSWLSGVPESELPRPAYSFRMPAAPSRAAAAEGKSIELSSVVDYFRKLPEKFWIAEGAGGLLVPLNEPRRELTRELILALELPLIVVASTRLGTINHTLLTLESARRAGIEVLGIVYSGPEDKGLEETIRSQDSVPVLARIPDLGTVTPEGVHALGPELFPSLEGWAL